MVGQEIACSIVALVVALIFGLFFGLLYPLFVIYYKLNHLEVWVSDIVLHKSEVNAEAARVIKQFNSDLRIFTSSQPNDENQQPESDGEIHAESDGEIHFVDAKQTKAGIGGAAQQPATQAEISGATQQPATPSEIGGASQQPATPTEIGRASQQPAIPTEIGGAAQQPACPHSLLQEHVASLLRMKDEGIQMVHYKKLYGHLVVILPIILIVGNKSWKKKNNFVDVFESYFM